MFHTFLKTACLPTLLLVPGLAWADEPPPAVRVMLANLERQMAAKPSYEALTVDGSGGVTITNLMISQPARGEEPGVTLKTGQIELSAITEQGPGFWEVGSARFANTTVEISGKDGTVSASLPSATADGWFIREAGEGATPQDKLLSQGTYARKMAGGPLSISASGQTVTVDSIETSWNGDPATGAGNFSSKISNVTIPEAVLMEMGEGGMLRQLGYSALNLDLTSNASLNISGDKLGYDFGFTLSARDMGSLGVTGTVADIPVDAYNAFMQANQDGQPADLEVYGPQLENVVVTAAAVRFENASIFGKLMPLIAAAQGMDEKTLLASIPPTLQLMLVQMQNEAFTAQAVDSVTRFLADPKSLTISMKPPSPLKVSDFEALQQSPPGEAIGKIGLAVSAND